MKTGRKNYKLKKRGKWMLTKMTKKDAKDSRRKEEFAESGKETFF
jgi:hypothetical protein